MKLTDLPNELLFMIVCTSALSYSDLSILSRTCKLFYRLLSDQWICSKLRDVCTVDPRCYVRCFCEDYSRNGDMDIFRVINPNTLTKYTKHKLKNIYWCVEGCNSWFLVFGTDRINSGSGPSKFILPEYEIFFPTFLWGVCPTEGCSNKISCNYCGEYNSRHENPIDLKVLDLCNRLRVSDLLSEPQGHFEKHMDLIINLKGQMTIGEYNRYIVFLEELNIF